MRSLWLIPLLLLATLAACRSRTAPGDEVWAEVNGQPLYRSQVEKLFAQQVAALPEPLTREEALAHKLRLLSELIHDEILWQKAAQAGLLASDNEVEARFQELRTPFSEEEFQQQLEVQRMTPAELRAELRRQIAIRKLLDQRVSGRIEVSDREVADYYQQHKSQFRFLETSYRVAYLLVTPRSDPDLRNLRNDDAATDAQARRKLDALLERLRAGEDFGELARNFSEDPSTALQGGDLGFFPESALASTPAPLRTVVLRMQAGQVIGPIQTEKGYHLVKLIEREPAGQRELSDPRVQQAIRERLHRQKRQLLEAAYAERARNQARVVNYLARQILESQRVSP